MTYPMIRNFSTISYKTFWLSVILTFLQFCDVFFTMELLNEGYIEANPILNIALDVDFYFFVLIKFSLFTIGLIALLTINPSRIRNKIYKPNNLLLFFVLVYSTVVYYQITSLMLISL